MTSKRSRSGVWFFLTQRVTALVLGIYTCVVLGFFLQHTASSAESLFSVSMTYTTWQVFFTSTPMLVLYLLALVSLLAHTWIGLWTVVTDYVRGAVFGGGTDLFRKLLLVILAMILLLYLYLGLNVI